jgi:uncharacterized protein YjiS (DUF1127 family)
MASMPTSRLSGYFWNATLEEFAERCIAAAAESCTRRDIRRTLGDLSDDALRDIGLIRNDLEAACSYGAHHAAAELETAARRRSGNW